MKQLFREHRMEIGIILALAGIQFSIIIKEILGNSAIELTNILFAASVLFVIDYKNLFKFQIYRMNGITLAVFLYNVYAFTLGMMAGYSMWQSVSGLIYTLYIIAFILALTTNNKPLNGDFLIKAMWLSTGIFSVLLCYLVSDGFQYFGNSIMTLSGGADRLSLSVIAFYQLCAALLYHAKNKYLLALKVVFICFALYDVMICSRRGLMVAMIIVVFYHWWSRMRGEIKAASIVKVFGTIICAFLLGALLGKIFPGLPELISTYWNRLASGVGTYFGSSTYGIDAAASSRNNALNSFWSDFTSGSISEMVLGHGYVFWWRDLPYLEAFLDLGIVGGVWYLWIQLFYPITILLKRINSQGLRFAQYFAILNISYNLYSGVPYGNYKFVGLILLVYAARYCEFEENEYDSEYAIGESINENY